MWKGGERRGGAGRWRYTLRQVFVLCWQAREMHVCCGIRLQLLHLFIFIAVIWAWKPAHQPQAVRCRCTHKHIHTTMCPPLCRL
jgi:hypothetical protein